MGRKSKNPNNPLCQIRHALGEGVTQVSMAQRLLIPISTLKKMERGLLAINQKVKERVREYCGASIVSHKERNGQIIEFLADDRGIVSNRPGTFSLPKNHQVSPAEAFPDAVLVDGLHEMLRLCRNRECRNFVRGEVTLFLERMARQAGLRPLLNDQIESAASSKRPKAVKRAYLYIAITRSWHLISLLPRPTRKTAAATETWENAKWRRSMKRGRPWDWDAADCDAFNAIHKAYSKLNARCSST